LNRLTANYAEQAQRALALREVMKVSVYRLQTCCGCAKYRCVQPDGARHPAMVLSWKRGGRSHLRALLPADGERVERLTRNYKQLRRVRRRLHHNVVAALDQRERLLLVPPPTARRSTWYFALTGCARHLSRPTALKAMRSRWHIENTAFHQRGSYWNLEHAYRHTPAALHALFLIWMRPFNLLAIVLPLAASTPRSW
jgi:hypothetical protein